MNKTLLASAIAVALGAGVAGATDIIGGRVPVDNLTLDVNGANATVAMTLDTRSFTTGRNHEYSIQPVLVAADGSDSIVMPEVVIAGRSMWYGHVRNNDVPDHQLFRAGKTEAIPYSTTVAAAPWLADSRLKLNILAGNCCKSSESSETLATVKRLEYVPAFNYITPVADTVKVRNLEGSAFVNFPVNKITLLPDYMTNPVELRKITGTIDSVKADPDITITSITIKGFASPEGPYNNNVRLAKGRTETLKNYVEQLYHFAPGFIHTSYEPEDWQGLRDYVENSALPNRAAILEVIDSSLAPDAKDRRLATEFPSDYAFLLREVYPSLRHSDYRIDYRVKSFTSLSDILRVLATDPGKLSLNEFYRAAQSMTPGSAEYNDVFETAVRLYPADPAANLNAANIAMSRGEYAAAERYLAKAYSDDPTVIYAHGVLEALQGRYEQAADWFARAARLKVADAPAALATVRELAAHGTGYVLIPE